MRLANVLLFFIAMICVLMMFFSFRIAVGSLYRLGVENTFSIYNNYLFTEKNTSNDEFTNTRRQLLDELHLLTKNMLAWDQHNPVNNSYAAYTYLLDSYALDNLDQYDYFLTKSVEYNDKAIAGRPIYPEIYVQQAYAHHSLSTSITDVLHYLHKAEQFGPYEKSTAKAGIDFYFKYWAFVDADNRTNAVKYVLEHHKYGLNYGDMRNVINKSTSKEQLCSLLKYKGEHYSECK